MRGDAIWLSGRTADVSRRLRIVGVGYNDRMSPGMVDRPRGTDDHLFMHFHTPVRVWHDGEARPFPAHTFFLWRPRNRHTFGNPDRNWSHSWIHCHGPAVAEALAAARIALNRPISFPDAYLIERNAKPIFDELRENAAPDPVILECRLAIWVREIERESNPGERRAKIPDRTLRALRFIESRMAEPLTLADAAAEAHLSVSRFSAEFRAFLGTSPMDYLLKLRLRHAEYHLRDRNLNIEEVAARVGFSDPFYFSRQFRKRHGLSPMQYRGRILKW